MTGCLLAFLGHGPILHFIPHVLTSSFICNSLMERAFKMEGSKFKSYLRQVKSGKLLKVSGFRFPIFKMGLITVATSKKNYVCKALSEAVSNRYSRSNKFLSPKKNNCVSLHAALYSPNASNTEKCYFSQYLNTMSYLKELKFGAPGWLILLSI